MAGWRPSPTRGVAASPASFRGRLYLRLCEGDSTQCTDLGTGETYLLTSRDADAYIGVQATVTDGDGNRHRVVTVVAQRVNGPAVVASVDHLRIEEGHSATYEVELAAAPDDTVSVAVAGADGTDVAVDPATLTFAPGAWDVAQTVTVTVGADADAASDAPVTLAHDPSGAGLDGRGGDLVVVLPGEEDGALAATFSGLPRSHLSWWFEFDVSFGREVAVTAARMRNDVFDVAGGRCSARSG